VSDPHADNNETANARVVSFAEPLNMFVMFISLPSKNA